MTDLIPASTMPLTRRQRGLLTRAARLALTSNVKQKHGAIVVKGGSVIAHGVNSYTNDPTMFPVDAITSQKLSHLERGKFFSEHAEMAALRRIPPEQRKGAVLYVARVMKNGDEGLSAPCDFCAKAIREAGIKRVVFS